MDKLPDIEQVRTKSRQAEGKSPADLPLDRLYWNPEAEERLDELMSPDNRAKAFRKLQLAVRALYRSNPYWRERLDDHGCDPRKIKTPEDFARMVPPFDKEAHRLSQESSSSETGLAIGAHVSLDPEALRLICATSGTTGNPTYYLYDRGGIAASNEVYARALWRAGIRPGTRVLHAFALSMFAAGIPMVNAISAMGGCAIPVGAEAGTERLLKQADLLKPQVLTCTPSYADYLIERCREITGRDIASFGFETLIVGGEPGGSIPDVRERLERSFGAKVFDMQGPALTCEAHEGFHMISLGSAWYEMVDPETKELLPLEDGAEGEWITTSLSVDKSVAPILRMAVGDIYRIRTSPCACGRSGWRYSIVGRTDEMLKVKGVMVYPAAITKVVNGLGPGVDGAYRIVLKEPPPRVQPPLLLRLELAAGVEPSDELDNAAKAQFHEALRIRPEIEWVPQGTLSRSQHKGEVFERLY